MQSSSVFLGPTNRLHSCSGHLWHAHVTLSKTASAMAAVLCLFSSAAACRAGALYGATVVGNGFRNFLSILRGYRVGLMSNLSHVDCFLRSLCCMNYPLSTVLCIIHRILVGVRDTLDVGNIS